MTRRVQEAEQPAFDFFFAGILSMRCHPGTTRDEAHNWSMEQMAELAIKAVEYRREVFSGRHNTPKSTI